jgi:predicted phage-related endonuclease
MEPKTLEFVEQRTQDWYEARLGKATASRFKDILATIGKGEAAARRNYRAQIVVERLTGNTPDRFNSAAMEWGSETEELAKTIYMMKTDIAVEDAGFYQHPTIAAGASPDGLIGTDGLLEIKCRNTANHIETLKTGYVPLEYIPQIQGQLWLTSRKWCDFVSFDPDMPENAQIFIRRINREEEYIQRLERQVITFLKEVDADVNYIKSYSGQSEVNK